MIRRPWTYTEKTVKNNMADAVQECLVRPQLAPICSQQEFDNFKYEWRMYHDSVGDQPVGIMQVQLYCCAEASLKRALYMSIGDRHRTMGLEDIMGKMEKLVV
jgi:hypothetical protein